MTKTSPPEFFKTIEIIKNYLTLLGASPRGFLLLRSGNPPSPQA